MYYGYDICPKCKDRLIVRNECKEHINDFSKCSGDICDRCGNKLVLACAGDKEEDDTIYKIVLEDILNNNEKSKCIGTIMKMLNCDSNLVKEAIYGQNDFCITGNFLNTYLYMEILDDAGILYNVIPEFPFQRFIYPQVCLCPDCGKETSEKIESADGTEGYLKEGIYCEHCKDWVMYRMVDKREVDRTVYQLEIFWEGIDKETREKIETNINNLTEKERDKDRLVVYGMAMAIFEVLQKLEKQSIGYKVSPPFPYEISEFREMDEGFLNEVLKLSNKWEELC